MTAHNVTPHGAWTYGSTALDRAESRTHTGAIFGRRTITDGGEDQEQPDDGPDWNDDQTPVPVLGAERLALDPDNTTDAADPKVVAQVAAVSSHLTAKYESRSIYTLAPVTVENTVYYGVTSYPPEHSAPARETRGVVAHDRHTDTWTVAVFEGERQESNLLEPETFDADDVRFAEKWDLAENAINHLRTALGGDDRYTEDSR